ncbi:MAG: peptide-methionine (S)-S-oxide reductase MsrA [Actinobacteria bacterium]|nr:peptide-methionine (S)-S-oxide reductase MsrA [Actinomycetota bacterium]
MSDQNEIAVFGGGCFWCVEAAFSLIKGVIKVESGYAGGFKKNPTYREVCGGGTGHAEVLKIEFSTEVVSYEKLLEVFFYIHNPTTLNRQGNDIGEQYRSIILYTTEKQKSTAHKFIENLRKNNVYSGPITTEIKPMEKFFKAEEYHQDYFKNNRFQPYCQAVISPKVQSFQKKFEDILK